MDRLYFAYYILTMSAGIFCLGYLLNTTLNNKNEAIRLYFIFYAVFSAFIMATVLRVSLLTGTSMKVTEEMFTVLQFLMLFSSLYVFACLVNKVLLVPAANKINAVLLFVMLVGFVLSVLEQFVFEVGIEEVFDAAILIFYLSMYIKYKKNIINVNLKKAMRHTFWSMLLFIPGIVLDEIIISKGLNLHIIPFFYTCIGIYSVFSFQKISNSIQNKKYQMPKDLIQRFSITEREAEVMELLLKGHSYSKIAEQLVISISTVRTHVTNLYKKASVNSRYELYNLFE